MQHNDHTPQSLSLNRIGWIFAIVLACPLLSPRAQAQATSTCLIYTSRSTSSTTGYNSQAYNSTGIMVLGPEFTEPTEFDEYVNATKRKVQEYFLYTSGKQKFYSKVQSSGPEGENNNRVVGFFDMARKNSSKPSLFFAMSTYDYAPTGLNDYNIIGRAINRAPYTGARSILMAGAMQSSYKGYNLNPDMQWDGEGDYSGKSLGQDGEIRSATLTTSGTTYSYNPKLSKLTESKDFAGACAAIEEWLADNKYTSDALLPE